MFSTSRIAVASRNCSKMTNFNRHIVMHYFLVVLKVNSCKKRRLVYLLRSFWYIELCKTTCGVSGSSEPNNKGQKGNNCVSIVLLLCFYFWQNKVMMMTLIYMWSWCISIAHVWFPVQLLWTLSSYLLPFLKYLTCNFDDLKLGQFRVIQG